MLVASFKTKYQNLVDGTTAAAVALDEIPDSEMTKVDLGVTEAPTTHPAWRMINGDWRVIAGAALVSLNLVALDIQRLSTGTRILIPSGEGLAVAAPGGRAASNLRAYRTPISDGQGGFVPSFSIR